MKTSTSFSCLCVLVGSLLSAPSNAAVPRQHYDALILDARAGNYEPALEMLRQHGIEHPMDLRAAYDHILIASWAGRPQEAIAAYEAISPRPNRPPADVLEAVAGAYRDAERWDDAILTFRDGRRLYPRRSSFQVGEIKTLSDAGRTAEAVALGQSLVEQRPEDADLRLALSYAYRGQPSPYPVFEETAQAYELAPSKGYVTREYVDSLEQAGVAKAALDKAKENPGVLSASDLRDLEGDYAAELVRLAAMPVREDHERFAIADRALAEYDRLIPAWEALGPEAQEDVNRLRIDRLQALLVRDRMRDVVMSYEEIIAEGREVPRYALNDVAWAYLEIRQPEVARDLFRRVLNDPASKTDSPMERLNNETGLFYALIETEAFDEATKVAETALAGQARWRFIRGVPKRIPNDPYLYAEQLVALGKFYADDTKGAQEHLQTLADAAPRNVGLKTSLANVYRGRGWPRASEKLLKSAESLEPRGREVVAGQGFTAIDLQEWRQAELLTQNSVSAHPDEPTTRDLVREWTLHNKSELRVQATRGLASDSPVTGSGDMAIESVLYSAPLNYNWRAFGGVGYSTGEFPEGEGDYRWLRTGVEWRGRDLTTELEVSGHDYGYGDKMGARVSATYDLDDAWQIGGEAALRSLETPLRALRSNITSNSVGLFVRWEPNDHRDWRFSISPSRFSDGNNRLVALLSGRERLYTSPHLKADLRLDVGASRNTIEDAPYFNPRADLEIVPSVNLTHILYRRYETFWEQNFLVGAGTYSQRGFGTGGIAAVGYGMRYSHEGVFDIGANVTGISRPYDGEREREVRIMLEMTFRF